MVELDLLIVLVERGVLGSPVHLVQVIILELINKLWLHENLRNGAYFKEVPLAIWIIKSKIKLNRLNRIVHLLPFPLQIIFIITENSKCCHWISWSIQFDLFNIPCVSNLSTSKIYFCLLYTSPSPRDRTRSRMPSSA